MVIRVLPDGPQSYAVSALPLAANFADQGGAREERRAAELLGEDFADAVLSNKDRLRLRAMLAAIDKARELILERPDVDGSIARLRLVADLD
ncbi:MAG: hypothetical protein NVS3B18_13130 [Candidatus Dormibacteria bacterium]